VNTFATISIIGVAVDDDTKSIACYASISNKKLSNHRTNEYIEAEIITNTEPVMALPSGAVIKNENGYFVLVLDKQESERYFFRKAEVKIGKQQEGFTEIMEPRIDGPILTKGVYNLSL
jgi:cobalt-zinc-cadmium efflux system membrane fusion protein